MHCTTVFTQRSPGHRKSAHVVRSNPYNPLDPDVPLTASKHVGDSHAEVTLNAVAPCRVIAWRHRSQPPSSKHCWYRKVHASELLTVHLQAHRANDADGSYVEIAAVVTSVVGRAVVVLRVAA